MDFLDLLSYKSRAIKTKLEFTNFLNSIISIESIPTLLNKFKVKCNIINDSLLSPVSGLYDDTDNRIYITINTFYKLDEIKTELLITLCHELIHQRQFYYRDFQYPVYRVIGNPQIDYLSNPDEIEAYAHDIYLEIHQLGLCINLESNLRYQEYLTLFKSKSPIIKSLLKHYHRWTIKYQNIHNTK